MKKSFVLYTDIKQFIDNMNNEQAGELFRAILNHETDEDVVLDDAIVKTVFPFIKSKLDDANVKYEAKREKNRENAKKRWDKVKSDNMRPHTDACDTMPTDTVTDTDTDIISNDINNKACDKNYSNYNNPNVTMPLDNFKKAWGDVKWYSTSTKEAWIKVKGWEQTQHILDHLKLWQESEEWAKERGKYKPKSSDFLLEYLEQKPTPKKVINPDDPF